MLNNKTLLRLTYFLIQIVIKEIKTVIRSQRFWTYMHFFYNNKIQIGELNVNIGCGAGDVDMISLSLKIDPGFSICLPNMIDAMICGKIRNWPLCMVPGSLQSLQTISSIMTDRTGDLLMN